jgi:hypothetical protein
MITIDKQRAAAFLSDETGGRIFTVTFRKKDGTERTINARRGVTKHLTGGSLRYNPEDKGVLSVYSLKDEGYRMINLDSLISFKIGGHNFAVK